MQDKKILGNYKGGLEVSSLGLGCENITEATEEVIKIALENGLNFFDTADIYGEKNSSEITLGKILKNYPRESFVIATKCGCIINDHGDLIVNGSKSHISKSCIESLDRLQTDYIDLFYLHRVDPATPIEESVAAMAELVQKGKIKHIGLSEVTAEQIKKAHSIHPITSVQIEFSPWSQHEFETGVIDTCQELGIGLVAYSPLGRAFFVDENQQSFFKSLPESDDRATIPRYQGERLNHNLELRIRLQQFVQEYEYSLLEFVLAWSISKNMVPIPGTTKINHLLENISATKIKIPEFVIQEFDKLVSSLPFSGERYSFTKDWYLPKTPKEEDIASSSNDLPNVYQI